MTFRMGHQAEHAAGRIADSGHVSLRAVWVDGIRARTSIAIDIAQDDLACLLKPLQDPRLPADELAFRMSDRQMHALVAGQKGTLTGSRLKVNPAVLEFAGSIPGKRCQG